MSASITVGHRAMAWRRNSISGAVSSDPASETSISPSEKGRKAMVAAAWPPPRPPMPGVSTSITPSASRRLGTEMSTRSTPLWLPSLPCSVTQSPTVSTDTSSAEGAPCSSRRRTTAWGVSPCWTKVMTEVARSSSTGQTSLRIMALTNELFPCLNSPTTHTMVAALPARAAAALMRSARSVRPCRPTS